MDIFKFTNPEELTKMQYGEIVNGLTSKEWIERYAEAGEFTFRAPAHLDMKRLLPEGAFVSHVNTTDLMIVENHEISEDEGADAEWIITGRGFETCLEQRIVGTNKTFPSSAGVEDYVLPGGQLWTQIRDLIREHTLLAYLVDDNNSIPFLQVLNTYSGPADAQERTVRQNDLYSVVLGLLAEGNLGIKTIRPGPWSPATNDQDVVIAVHGGAHRESSVTFSHDTGEVESADYFWTNRKNKNCAFVNGRWVETTVMIGSPVKWERRWMKVDASDIDQKYTSAPTGATLTNLVAKMQQRGRTELAKQKNIALTKAEVSKQSVQSLYRTDYDLGDLVSVEGNYNEVSVQRVTEYVEIEDETGRSSYPTLSDPE
jgi:hypothetical protein